MRALRAAENVSVVVPEIIWHKWAVKDSNLRSRLTTDLQSVPFGHLGNRPIFSFLSRCQLEFEASAGPERQLTTEADDGNRTHNRPLTRRVLYPLSYVGGLTLPL